VVGLGRGGAGVAWGLPAVLEGSRDWPGRSKKGSAGGRGCLKGGLPLRRAREASGRRGEARMKGSMLCPSSKGGEGIFAVEEGRPFSGQGGRATVRRPRRRKPGGREGERRERWVPPSPEARYRESKVWGEGSLRLSRLRKKFGGTGRTKLYDEGKGDLAGGVVVDGHPREPSCPVASGKMRQGKEFHPGPHRREGGR